MIVPKKLWYQLAALAIGSGASAQTPLTLHRVLEQVRANNPALRVERLNIPVAQANQVTANLRPNPYLNNQTLVELSQTLVPGRPADPISVLNRGRRQFWLQATKEFDIFGKRPARNQFAEAGTALAVRSVAETERTLLLDAANRYVDAWYAGTQVSLLLQAKDNADTLTRLNQNRLHNLVISRTDLIRTQLLSDQYLVLLHTAQQDFRNRQNELRFAMGSVDSLVINVEDSLLNTIPVTLPADRSLDTLLGLAVTNRADAQAAHATLEMARRNVDLQRVLAHPRNEAGVIWNPQNTILYGGTYITLELPLYNRNQGGIQKSTVLLDQASLIDSLAPVRIRLEVENAYQLLASSRQNVDRYTAMRLDADRVLASVRYAYLRGASTLIDWLQAQRFWFDTQKGYYSSAYSYRRAYVRLLYTSGLINRY